MKFSKPFYWTLALLCLITVALTIFVYERPFARRARWIERFGAAYVPQAGVARVDPARCSTVLRAARALVTRGVRYDEGYFPMSYPGGDAPAEVGACTDVLIRSFRAVDVDLQKLVHEDIERDPERYPGIWFLASADTNIDHRRVPNLMAYFKANGGVLPISKNAADFAPCDVVTWDTGQGITHIGLVSDRIGQWSRPMIIHHIGGHPTEEDSLFDWRMIGHFRPRLGAGGN